LSDPREDVAFDEIGAERATYEHDSSIVYDATKAGGSDQVGLAVKVVSAKTVALTTDGSEVEGKLILVEPNGFCVVQYDGFMKLPGGNGASLTHGKKIVGALDASSNHGYIREVATATAAELGVARGRIIDASDTTEVVVDL
jgi:hypothetical protein